MNEVICKVSTGIFLAVGLLAFSLAHAEKLSLQKSVPQNASAAPLKKGAVCSQITDALGGWIFECDNLGKNNTVAGIYAKGWRIVSTTTGHDYKGEYVVLFIEEQ